jgi:hypothetical protein
MPFAITLLVYALAVARVTRLVTSDKLTEMPRTRLEIKLWQRFAPQVPASDWHRAVPPLPVYLLTCPWCVSVYVGAVAAPLVAFLGDSYWVFVPALALAFSHFTGLLAKIGA